MAIGLPQHPAQRGKGFFYRFRVPHLYRGGGLFLRDKTFQLGQQFLGGAFLPGGAGDYRYAQQGFQSDKVNLQVPLLGFIHQVQAYGSPRGNFQGLQNKIKIAFQAGGITHHIRPLAHQNR